jgi:transposase InsO family protein
VLYSAAGDAEGHGTGTHTHWMMRSIPSRRIQAALGDEHVTPAIWRALYRLHPDCILMDESRSFASRATIAWCRLRGIPYVVVAPDEGSTPSFLRRAAAVVVDDEAAEQNVVALGVDPGRTHVVQPGADAFADAILAASRIAAKREINAQAS